MTDQTRKIAKAAGFIMVTTIVARLLGYVRDWFIYTRFGETYATDAFNAAFSIPDTIYMLLVGGALSSAFIPVFSSYLATDREEEAWKTASIVFNYTMLFLAILIGIAFIEAAPLINLLAPKLPPEYKALAVHLTRIMFVQTFFMALNGLSMGILNSQQHFTTPALGGIVYNLGIITVGLLFVKDLGVEAFSLGVVAGAILNFCVQVPALIKVGVRYIPSLDYRNQGFRQILILMLPVVIGLSVTQLNLFVSQNLASGLAEGSISALRIAQRIQQLPTGIFAISIAVAVFPTLTALAARKEYDEFQRTMSLALRGVFFIILPSAAGIMAIGEPLIRLAFEWQNFTSSHTVATAQVLYYYCLGLVAYSALQVLNRIYYALKDTVTPVVTGIVTIALNIMLSILLVKPMQANGLAFAYSLAGFFNMLALVVILKFKLGRLDGRRLLSSFITSLAISVVMFFVARESAILVTGALHFAPKLNELIGVLVAVALGVAVYAIGSLALRMEEAELIKRLLARRIPFLKWA